MKKLYSLLILTLCFAWLASCSHKDSDVPQGMKIASGEYSDYNLYVPEKWTVETSTGVITAKYSDSVMVNVTMTAASLIDGVSTLDEYWNWFRESFEQNITGFQEEANEDMLLDGHAAKKYIYSGAVAGVDVKYLQCICIKDKAVYIFTYTASPEQYDQYTDDIDRMLETFTFK